MTSDHRALLTRRRFLAAAASVGALAATPARAQEQPPIIEPIDEPASQPVDQPVEQPPIVLDEIPEDTPSGEIVAIAEESTGEYVAETGHNIDEPFLAVWRQAGAREVVGLPLSEERFDPDAGVVEQYFEGIVLVNAPNAEGQWVTFGRELGETRLGATAPASARAAVAGCAGEPGCQFFPETGHTIAGEIASRWTAGGEAAIFGLPLTEPYRAEGVTRQVFQRAVLDRASDGTVTAAPVGRELVETLGLAGDPAFLPAPPTLGTSTLVSASDGLRLRSEPSTDADVIAVLEDNAEFIAVTGASGEWIPGYADGYSGYVAAEYLTAREALPEIAVGGQWDTSVWLGRTLSESNLRSGPGTTHRIVRTVPYGEEVAVTGWVKGERIDGGSDTWAQLADGTYLFERQVGRAGPVEAPPPPADAPWEGKWIDCNLTQQLLVAYEGRGAVRVAVTTTGKPGWETPPGFFLINNRVPNETMESGSIGAEEFYKLENVLYTQYFTDRGHAIHFAWWKTPETIGRPGSHGCLNLLLDDAAFFWNWADYGVPVYCHY